MPLSLAADARRRNTPCRPLHRTAAALVAAGALALPGLAAALTLPLPPPGEDIVGEIKVVQAKYEDALVDIAHRFSIGYDELIAANPTVDRWLPGEGTPVVIPRRFILPDAPRRGVVINLAEMRIYYFPPRQGVVVTYPIGIGREGWSTPTGKMHVVEKIKGPTWVPPESIRREHAKEGDILPAMIKPGPDNPLGGYAFKLSRPGYLFHGTNKPEGVGMRVSHGCIRLYPEDIEQLFPLIPVGTEVNIVNQTHKVGWHAGNLYAEVQEPLPESGEFTPAPSPETMAGRIEAAAKGRQIAIDWDRARLADATHRGVPIRISQGEGAADDQAMMASLGLDTTGQSDAAALAAVATTQPEAAAPAVGDAAPPATAAAEPPPAVPEEKARQGATAAERGPAAPAEGELPPVSDLSPPAEEAPVVPAEEAATTVAATEPDTTLAETPIQEEPLPLPEAEESAPPAAAAPGGRWLLQVGAFQRQQNADRALQMIQEKAVAVPARVERDGNSGIYRVFAGPFASRSQAEELRQRITQSTGMLGLVTETGRAIP